MILMYHLVLIIESISFLEIEEKTNPDLCTYLSTGNAYLVQEFFHCNTCSLGRKEQRGACKVCIKTCHAGHDVKFAANIASFCNCGMKGEKFCCSLLKKQTGKLF